MALPNYEKQHEMVLLFSFWQLIIYFVFSSSAIRPLVTYAFQAMVFPELLSWLFLTKSFRLDKNSRNMNDQNPSFEKLSSELRIAIFFPGNFYLLSNDVGEGCVVILLGRNRGGHIQYRFHREEFVGYEHDILSPWICFVWFFFLFFFFHKLKITKLRKGFQPPFVGWAEMSSWRGR